VSLRPAVLLSGPLDGQGGEVVSPLPDHLAMGENGGFIYRLDTVKDGVVRFRYDPRATRARLTDLGLHPDLLRQVDDDPAAQQLARTGGHLEPQQQTAFDVQIRRFDDRWELHVGGTLVEQQPRAAFRDDDTDALAQWAESAVHALAQEALR
jgi:hypothetical protein